MLPLAQAAVSAAQDPYNLTEHIGALYALAAVLLAAFIGAAKLFWRQFNRAQQEREKGQDQQFKDVRDLITGLTNTVAEGTAQDADEHREFRQSFLSHGERIGRLEGAVFRYGHRRESDDQSDP